MFTDLMTLADVFIAKGDIAHLALFLWAATATLLLTMALRELGAANHRVNDFIELLARFATKIEDA
jgi:hypothetical protein